MGAVLRRFQVNQESSMRRIQILICQLLGHQPRKLRENTDVQAVANISSSSHTSNLIKFKIWMCFKCRKEKIKHEFLEDSILILKKTCRYIIAYVHRNLST